jgi:hypothetical protein
MRLDLINPKTASEQKIEILQAPIGDCQSAAQVFIPRPERQNLSIISISPIILQCKCKLQQWTGSEVLLHTRSTTNYPGSAITYLLSNNIALSPAFFFQTTLNSLRYRKHKPPTWVWSSLQQFTLCSARKYKGRFLEVQLRTGILQTRH